MPKLMQKKVDPDDILTEQDLKDIAQAEKEIAAGKTVSWKELKKRLGVDVRRSTR